MILNISLSVFFLTFHLRLNIIPKSWYPYETVPLVHHVFNSLSFNFTSLLEHFNSCYFLCEFRVIPYLWILTLTFTLFTPCRNGTKPGKGRLYRINVSVHVCHLLRLWSHTSPPYSCTVRVLCLSRPVHQRRRPWACVPAGVLQHQSAAKEKLQKWHVSLRGKAEPQQTLL